jgi:RimJ/RimL family protein N-acetyltransferase
MDGRYGDGQMRSVADEGCAANRRDDGRGEIGLVDINRTDVVRLAMSRVDGGRADAQREQVMLANQADVWIRALRGGEEQAIRDLLLDLDPVSWYCRFLSPYPTGLDVLVPLLAHVDDERRLTLVAEHRVNGSTRMIGIANVAVTDSGDAEVGLVISGDWQRRRLGTELALRALRAAETRGVTRFVGHVASRNVQARRLLAKVGVVLSVRFAGRVSEYCFTRRSRPVE